MEQILKELKACKTFYDFLVYIRDTRGLELVQDNGWYWLEYNGEEIEGTGKERFTSSSEMNDLLRLAMRPAVEQSLQATVSGSVFILINGRGDNTAYIIKDEKELERWKSDGSTEKGDKLYKAVLIEQF